jgi:hypothetical protein
MCELEQYRHFAAKLPLNLETLGSFRYKVPLYGQLRWTISTCLLVEFPLPRRAVLFLVVDCDLRIRPVRDQEGARQRLRDGERRVPGEGGQAGLNLVQL